MAAFTINMEQLDDYFNHLDKLDKELELRHENEMKRDGRKDALFALWKSCNHLDPAVGTEDEATKLDLEEKSKKLYDILFNLVTEKLQCSFRGNSIRGEAWKRNLTDESKEWWLDEYVRLSVMWSITKEEIETEVLGAPMATLPLIDNIWTDRTRYLKGEWPRRLAMANHDADLIARNLHPSQFADNPW